MPVPREAKCPSRGGGASVPREAKRLSPGRRNARLGEAKRLSPGRLNACSQGGEAPVPREPNCLPTVFPVFC